MTLEQLEAYTNLTGKLVCLSDAVLFYALWNVFYHSAKEKITVIASCVLFVINAVMIFCFDLSGSRRLMIYAVFIIVYGILRYGRHCEKTVFAVILFYALRCISWLFSNSVFQMISSTGIDRLAENNSPPEKMFLFTFISGLGFFTLMIILFVVMILIIARVIKGMEEMNLYDACFLSFFSVISILFTGIFVRLNVIPLDNDTFVLYDNMTALYWKLPLLSVLLYLGELTAIIILKKYKDMQKREELYFAEQLQVKAMKLRLEEAEGFYDGIKSVKHEMKNHLTNIKSLASRGKYEEVEKYISKLDISMEKLEYKYSTENPLTDVIINDKHRRAENAGIKFEMQFLYKDIEGIDVFDFGIVLNNLLDNAITACESVIQDKRFIRLSMQHKKKFLILEVENSFSGNVVFAEDGMPVTTKTSETGACTEHGVGLKNVRDIAERYLGTLDIKVEGDIFKVTVLMQEK